MWAFNQLFRLDSRKTPNARINPPGNNCGTDKLTIRDKLIPVGFNELLDFVSRDPSAFRHLSLLTLPFNIPSAAWRFIFDYL